MFSIIVPSYNRNEEVNQLLISLQQQTLKSFEVIVVDDYSPNPIKIDRSFEFDVKLLRNEQNSGPAYSRNRGAEAAQYNWLLFLDDDDRFAAQKCERLAQEIGKNPNCNFIYHSAKCLMINENFSYLTHPCQPQDLTLDNILLANKLGGIPMFSIKKDFYFQLGGLDTQLKSLEDYDFALKLVSSPELKAIYIDKPLTICAFHTKRASVSTNFSNIEHGIEEIKQRYVKTPQQAENYNYNSLYMMAYPYIMNLSRKAASYYWRMFKLRKNIKTLIIAAVILISPKLAINMKRFT